MVRIAASLRLLAQGMDVGLVASEVGYRSLSAFVVAFRRDLGCTPGRYAATDLSRPAFEGRG
jgi:AraC-like DNA-binding protein